MMTVDEERQHEPWPWILGAMIVTMMLVAISFAWIAHRLPDPVIVDETYEADGGSTGFHPRYVEPESVPRS